MKKSLKRILSGIIAASMLSVIPTLALAEDDWGYTWSFDDLNDINAMEYVNPVAQKTIGNCNGLISSTHSVTGVATDKNIDMTSIAGKNISNSELHRTHTSGLEFGIVKNDEKTTQTGGSIVVSFDFQIRSENITGYLMSPHFQGQDYGFANSIKYEGTKIYIANTNNGANQTLPIGEVKLGEWNNLTLRYDLTGQNLVYIYLNGESFGIRPQKYSVSTTVLGFLCNVSGTTPQYLQDLVPNDIGVSRCRERDEVLWIDNVYIGSDLSKTEFEPCISKITQDINDSSKLLVHFNKALNIDNYTTDDFWLSTADGTSFADATAIDWKDNQNVECTFTNPVDVNTEYVVNAGLDDTMSKKFKTDYTSFYDFDNTPADIFAVNSRQRNLSGREINEDSYSTAGKGYAIFRSGQYGTDDGKIKRESMGVQLYDGKISDFFGPMMVNFDFMVEDENISGGLVINATSADNIGYALSILSNHDSNGNYINTTLSDINGVTMAEIQPGKWYNLSLRFDVFSNSYLTNPIILRSEMILNGEKLDVPHTVAKGFVPNKFSFLSEAYSNNASVHRTTTEKFHIDNLYIGKNTDYTNSQFSAKLDGTNVVINAGAKDNASKIIAAAYKNKVFLGCVIKDFDVKAMETQTISIADLDQSQADNVRLFVFDDLATVNPYKAPNGKFVR